MDESRNVDITRSKSGLPCLSENGGGWTNTGEAQIITDGQGYPKRAIFVRTRGDLACKDHAIIPIRTGDHIITVNRHWDRVAIQVECIVSIEAYTATVVPETEPICFDAIEAAVAKAKHYHCRVPYYIMEDEAKKSEEVEEENLMLSESDPDDSDDSLDSLFSDDEYM